MAERQRSGFAARLRQLREAVVLTQEQLAGRAGLHKLGVAKLERGGREPAWATVLALADALGVPCDQFRGAAADPAPTKRGRHPKAPPTEPPPPQDRPKRKGRKKGDN
jgi:transcriptional regulator with XRE-family HTH domain